MNRCQSYIVIATTLLLSYSTTGVAQERREVPEPIVFDGVEHEDETSSVRAFVEKYRDTWVRQDVDAFIELHAENHEWINAYARMFRGKEPLRRFLVDRLFPAFDKAVSIQEAKNMKTISIRHLGSRAAVIHMYTDGNRGQSRNEGESARRTHVHLVLEKQACDWMVVHTAIMDAR